MCLLDFLCVAVIVGLFSAFSVLFMGRFEVGGASIRSWVQMRSPRLVSEAFSCDFCLCWWISLLCCVFIMPWMGFAVVFAAPLAAVVGRFFAA